ncbi:hypothetical protein PCK2_000491 [Pneumocystis canis]|nr:hypothetical protein PCK2_000491 [Pneumocystis canis]
MSKNISKDRKYEEKLSIFTPTVETNLDIICSHQHIPITSIGDILVSPNPKPLFVAQKFRIRARVIDFLPIKLEDFARPFCKSCQETYITKCQCNSNYSFDEAFIWQFAFLLEGQDSACIPDYISATAMFRAAFPYATDEEEKSEFDNYIIKFISSATSNEYTSGIWILFDDALSLSDDYGIKAWIKALINAPIERSQEDTMSPSKQLTATTFKKHIQLSTECKYKSLTIASNHNTDLSFETLPQNSHTKRHVSPQKPLLQSTKKEPSNLNFKSTETTTLSFSSMPDLSTSRNLKKRPFELCGPNDFIPIKRSKIEQLETEVVIERRRVKALFALAVSLGIRIMSNTFLSPKPTRLIPIYLSASDYFIYDPKTVIQLRLKYHICGFFIGTLPHAPQQNIFLGLPLKLMPEEAAWLVDQGLFFELIGLIVHPYLGHAYIVDDKLYHQLYIERATPEDVLSIKEKRIAEVILQNIEYNQQNTQKTLINCFNNTSVSKSDTDIVSQESYDPEDHIPRSIIVPIKSPKSIYTIPHESSPVVHVDSSRYSVWKYFHDKGYYITPGLKFGSHYLAYPGDPLRYHSHFLVNVVEWDEKIPMMNIIGGGRLGTNVKKAWVVAANNPDINSVRVFTIEWTGFG